jgi:hypothetical protein
MNDDDEHGFRLFRGGPLRRVGRLTHLARDEPRDIVRLSAALALVAWLPLVVLYGIDRISSGRWDPLFSLIEIHVRWLVAVPLLFAAERLVDERIGFMMRYFSDAGLVPAERKAALDRLERGIAAACDSALVEGVLLVISFVTSIVKLDTGDAAWRWWDCLVALPLFRFLLLRWLQRWLLWTALVGGIARLELDVIGLHPDRAGGLGVLVLPTRALGLVILAIGSVVASDLMVRMRSGVPFDELTPVIYVYVGLTVGLALLPLVAFMPTLSRAKHEALLRYGVFAQGYVHAFEERWLRHPSDSPLDNDDVQSLNDLGGAHDIIREMRLFPFSSRFVAEMVAIALLPILPLYLQSVSVATIAVYLAKAIF